MTAIDFFYQIKPVIPRRLLIDLSRTIAVRNAHPDDMSFDGASPHVLPREMARFCKTTSAEKSQETMAAKKPELSPPAGPRRRNPGPASPGVKIWIDLDNTPHVPFFIPIIRELERRGHEVVLTARDAFQVCDLAEEKGLSFFKVGRHYGKNPVMKITGLILRSFQLLPFYLRQRPGLSLSHGARSQNLLSNLLGVPTILIADYEHARTAPFTHPRWTIVPDALSPDGLPSKASHVRTYQGIKEDVYAPEFKPASSLRAALGLGEDEMIVTVRPPANEAHYYNPESDVLLHELMARICQTPGVRAVLLPRNAQQGRSFRAKFPGWFDGAKTIIPSRAVDGLDLLWISDFVVSGGGTMNREAAALGVPVYSIFRGKPGAVDLMLEEQGRLTMIRYKDEVWSKILFVRRDKNRAPDHKPRAALREIIDHIENIIRIERVRPRQKGNVRQTGAR